MCSNALNIETSGQFNDITNKKGKYTHISHQLKEKESIQTYHAN